MSLLAARLPQSVWRSQWPMCNVQPSQMQNHPSSSGHPIWQQVGWGSWGWIHLKLWTVYILWWKWCHPGPLWSFWFQFHSPGRVHGHFRLGGGHNWQWVGWPAPFFNIASTYPFFLEHLSYSRGNHPSCQMQNPPHTTPAQSQKHTCNCLSWSPKGGKEPKCPCAHTTGWGPMPSGSPSVDPPAPEPMEEDPIPTGRKDLLKYAQFILTG